MRQPSGVPRRHVAALCLRMCVVLLQRRLSDDDFNALDEVEERLLVAFVQQETGGGLPIIGVGGVFDPDDAVRLVDAGASLVQIYTGLVYRGPGLIRRTALALRERGE